MCLDIFMPRLKKTIWLTSEKSKINRNKKVYSKLRLSAEKSYE